ncbi:MAG: alpha/beta fold hydrolase, partial [Polyangiaceae bacterium]|nr:alpha/beta fold hydrolase [Polyangiaceae bacterium]
MMRYAATLALVLSAACSDEEITPLDATSSSTSASSSVSSGAGGAGGGPPTVEEITWTPCPLYVDEPSGPMAECATVDVPLRWSEPDGAQIGVFVQRLRGSAPTIRGQLWLLEGGPGGSGADFDSFMDEMHASDPTLDLYAVDHRGVGRSARLDCPEQETEASDWGISISPEEAPACRDTLLAKWGDGLAEFSSTAAARDLGELIERAKQPGQDVFVYGVSYGTYWAHRYLQVEPSQATAVVLDSIAPPGEDFVNYDADFDAVAHDLLDLCAADTLCSSKLGVDPRASLGDLYTALEAGHCSALAQTWGLDESTLPVVLAYLLMSYETRTYLPPLVYRLSRCDAADVTAIDKLLTVLFGSSTTSYYETLSSDALFYNVALSELWPNAASHPTIEEIAAQEAGLFVSTGLTPRVAAVQDVWPAYADDAYVDAWAETSTPLLMMNGDLDPQTPIWVGSEAADHLDGEGQEFVTVPRSAHCVLVQTPPPSDGDTPCGMKMFLEFIADPTAALDTSCLASIPIETFTGLPANNVYLVGTADIWENEPAAIAAPGPA